MKYGFEISAKAIREDASHPFIEDREHFIAHLDRLNDALINAGAGDPSVDADLKTGEVVVRFVIETESETEAFEAANRLFREAIEAAGGRDVSVDSLAQKRELVPA